jgi:hypothetical protein
MIVLVICSPLPFDVLRAPWAAHASGKTLAVRPASGQRRGGLAMHGLCRSDSLPYGGKTAGHENFMALSVTEP